MLLLLAVIFVALIFEFLNGFHDTANSVSCAVGTKVLTPNRAIALAAAMNLCGALAGTAVATTVGKGLVQAQCVTGTTLICALTGAILWNLVVRASFQLKSCAHWRADWCGHRFRRE